MLQLIGEMQNTSCCRSTHNVTHTHTLAPTSCEVTLFDRPHKPAAKPVVGVNHPQSEVTVLRDFSSWRDQPNHHVCSVTATKLFLPRLRQHLSQLCSGGAGELLKVTSLHPAEWLSWPCINITIGMTELLPRWLLFSLAFLLLCCFVSYRRTHSPPHKLFLICFGILKWSVCDSVWWSLLPSGIHGFVSSLRAVRLIMHSLLRGSRKEATAVHSAQSSLRQRCH